MYRTPSGISLVIKNLAADGVVTRVGCTDGRTIIVRDTNLAIPAGGTGYATVTAPAGTNIECTVTRGRGSDGQPELFISNNSLRMRL